MNRKRHQRILTLCVVPMLVLMLLAVHQMQQKAIASRMYADMEEKMLYLPSGKFIKQASLGMDAAIASLLWVRSLIYFGTHYTTDKDYRWLAHTLDVTTTLDPSFQRAYRVGGLLLSMEANHTDDSIRLIDKGIQHNPGDWTLHAAQGFNYFYFKEDKEKAAEYFTHAAQLPDAPEHIKRLAARMHAQTGKLEFAMEYLESLAQDAQDEGVREALTNRYKELVIEQHRGWLTALMQRYEEQVGHAPQTLDALVSAGLIGQLPPEPFGGHYIISPQTGQIESTKEDLKWP